MKPEQTTGKTELKSPEVELPPLSPREQGIADFKAGLNFAQCPYRGFREQDIDQRWHWQKGWLRAQLDKKDAEHPPKHNV